MGNFKEQLHKIKAFIFDVDGVFTNSNVFLHPGGDMMRSMNIKDGYAVQYAVKKGYIVGIISGGDSESVRMRFQRLGVTDIYLKSSHKIGDFDDMMYKYQLSSEEILYMGDDIPDFEAMKKSGIATCPADAVPEIKAISDYISDKDGGRGCVRDIIEQVLKLQGNWLHVDAYKW